MTHQPSEKAALRGEPSYVWRSGQDRRLKMMQEWSDFSGAILDAGCGLGAYLGAVAPYSDKRFGIDIEHSRLVEGVPNATGLAVSVGESLPFATNTFDAILSNEVIEHTVDDAACLSEMIRVTKPGGYIFIFCPNRWHWMEQHGFYWRGNYRFGNIPLINYLPTPWRDRLAPHVKAYKKRELFALFQDRPVTIAHHGYVFGGYDNIAYRAPMLAKILRTILYNAEHTPFAVLGISHFLVLRKAAG